MKPFRRARSAITGKFVSIAFALAHKAITVLETVRRKS